MINCHRPDETCTLVTIIKGIYEENHGWEQTKGYRHSERERIFLAKEVRVSFTEDVATA